MVEPLTKIHASGAAVPHRPVSDAAWSGLNHLRGAAIRARAAALADQGAVPKQPDTDPEAADDFAVTLVRFLNAVLPRDTDLSQPYGAETTFDEKWLLALIDAQLRADTDSLYFLANTRLKLVYHAPLLFLLSAFMENPTD